MKFTSILAVASSILALTNAQAPTLEQKWNISDEPTFEYSSLSFELAYTVSDFIKVESMAQFILYDELCSDAGGTQLLPSDTGALGIQGDLVVDASSLSTNQNNDPATAGLNMDRLVTVNITLDPETISDNPLLYSEDTTGSQVTAEIRFCLRFGLWTTSSTAVEVNFLETLVTLNVDLTDGFQIGSIAVEPRDRLVRTANQVYQVIGFRCGPTNQQITDNTPINQGAVVKVCVKPDAEAEADGIKMRSIDDFTWTRGVAPNTINQPAITGRNTPADNQLTTLDCTAGVDVCTFETILFAAFYTAAGQVSGSGIASMQFGSRRRLRSGAGDDRDLQEADDAAATAEFELDFEINQATVQGTSGGAAVSCVISAFMAGFGAAAVALM